MTACVLAVSLLVPAGTLLAAAPQQAPHPAQTQTRSPAPPPIDGGWPRMKTTPSGATVVVYEPQVESWPDQKHIVMYAAVSYTGTDAPAAELGTIKVEADTKVSVEDRLVNFSDLAITSANFPNVPRDRLAAVVDEIKAAVPVNERVIGLDRVLAAVDARAITPKNVDGVRADAPVIFYSDTPAILVNIDGEPIWSPIKENDLRFAVNTNWDLFEHGPSKTFYLRSGSDWLRATSLEGPWSAAGALPDSFARLPDDDNWKDVKAALPAAAHAPRPVKVFVSKMPAELILLHGAADYVPVQRTHLMWVSNTDSDLFRVGTNGAVYYLVSGRWFSAPTFAGPWTFATTMLPEDFKKIPLEHPRSRVLASVPGTTQALEGVLLAQVPQTARVSRTQVKPPDVVYQGDPQFERVDPTPVSRAVNTDKDILRVGDLYYMCFDGVWFMAKSPEGPWTVADSVPKEIYEIPIGSPAYDVTHVTVDSSDDEAVVFATDAAYAGLMVAWGCAVWGTGYYYPPYYWGGGYYPVYYPSYPTYGYGARYNPWTGAYTRGGVAYGPYGGAGYAARYNPTTGTYSRGAAAWGPGGARGAAEAWNPRTGTYAQTRQGSNVYGSWGATGVQRGDQWAKTARATSRATGNTTRVTQGSGGGSAVSRNGALGRSTVGTTGSGNVFAGHDGNVYRNQGGSWQKFDNGSWNAAERPTGTSGQVGQRTEQGGVDSATRDQLNRDRAARAEGAQRTKDLGKVKSNSGANRGGSSSFKPSGGGFGGGFGGGMRGGGMRGGGGRRR